MKREITGLLKNISIRYGWQKKWKKVVGLLSCLVALITIYALILPAVTESSDIVYKLYLKDSYVDGDYAWKKDNGYVTEFELNLYFEDVSGNSIGGRDVTLDIGPSTLTDVPYGFGVVPLENGDVRGFDVIEVLDLEDYVLETGEKYVFDHAEVYTDGAWQTFASKNSNYWHIWCQSSSSKSATDNYGWRGNYGESTKYTITEDTKYKFVYKLVRLGQNDTVTTIGSEEGISFNIFNYEGNNSEVGVNANGLYDYFSFRGIGSTDININSMLDEDGFTENRAKVLPMLDANGYPVFDCQGVCDADPSIINTSLGYLFGASTNAVERETEGVISYSPTNTLLQKEIVDEVEYYYYDSNRNAVDYDIENNRFMLRDYVERSYTMTTYANEASRYEFLPFNYITNIEENTLTNSTNNRAYNYEVEELDHWYGMTMEFTFYMPENGEINGKDMVFEFSGDDDVWVFIDDVLVLDLGGTHGAVDGSINFKTGYVEGYLNWNGTVGTKNITNIYETFSAASMTEHVMWNDNKTTLANYTKHTLKFFYLERGGSVANCKIRFNIPVLPNGSLSVQKQFVDTDKYSEDYEFRLYDVTANAPVVNTEYTIGQNKFTTDEKGKFTLKNTEVAVFKLLNEHKYYVEEIDTGDYAVAYSCSLDGVSCPTINKTAEFMINPESAYQAIFTNKVKTFDLEVSKIAYASEEDETFEFEINLKDERSLPVGIPVDLNVPVKYMVDYDMGIITFNLKNAESIIIKDIPIDTVVTLEEVVHDGYQAIMKSGDIVLVNGDKYEFAMDSDKDITVYNVPGVVLPETGGIGDGWYLILGSCLIIGAIKYGYSHIFKLKEGEK